MLAYISKVIEMSKRILVIDDEPDVNITLRKVLEKNGFIVDSYENPFLALENFKPHYYDLLILDIKMPKMSGFSFYREIKKRDDKLKICFLTAGEMYYGSYSDIFSSLPANCFIRKPVTNDELLKHMDRIMFGGRENYY
jgi:DNA-binding response OmpR family regulator